MTLLVATGLKREARILAGPGLLAIPGGGRSATLEAGLAAAAAGAEAIISLGLGGALAAGLAPGDWVVASAVVAEGQALATDPDWTAALARALPAPTVGAILGSARMLTTPREKQAAGEWAGALAVDMESGVAAQVARRFGLRFAAARVISDAANAELPPAVMVGLAADGGMALWPVLRSLARDPRQLGGVIATARDAERAFRALGQGRGLLRARLGLPDLLELPRHVG